MSRESSPLVYWMAAIVLTAAVLLGGGSHAGFPGDVATQFLALPLLVLGVRAWSVRMSAANHRAAETVLSAAILAVPVLLTIQLISWPDWLRAAWIEGLPVSPPLQGGDAAQQNASGLSVSPAATWAAAMSLIPFFALFFGISQLEEEERLRLARLILALMALALAVGFLQHMQGPSSALRFYAVTNTSSPVGFFANRNHFAAQLYTGLIFAAVWFGFSSDTLSRSQKTNSHSILWFAGLASLVVAVLCAIMVAQSRAGLILAVAAIGGIVAIFIAERREQRRQTGYSRATGKLMLACLVFGALFAAQFGISRVLTRFEADPLSDLRVKLTSATFVLAIESLPFGTGLGTFAQVYATTEKTDDLFDAYVNRAHNDWAELFLETGLPGAVAAGLFLIWFGWRAWLIWRRTPASRHIDRHLTLQRAATLVIALLLAHSLVDYPLRTTAMASIFAFACAIMVNPPARGES